MATKWANVILRELVWLVAFAFWAYYKKPDETGFLDIRFSLSTIVGLCLIVAGAVVHIWSAVVLAGAISEPTGSTNGLAMDGPYVLIRNPIYSAGAAIFVGIYLMYAKFHFLDLVAGMVVVLLLHFYVVRLEEPATRRRLGNVYDDYQRQVPRWVPRLSPR